MLDFEGEGHDEMLEREAADQQAERAKALLHATAVRYCPACATEVLAKRSGDCVWCDGPTTILPATPGERPDFQPGSTSPNAAASSVGRGAAATGTTEEEA